MASFDFNPNTRNYSLENAYWLSRASQLAYENESKISQGIQAWGFNDFKYYEHKKLETLLQIFAGKVTILCIGCLRLFPVQF